MSAPKISIIGGTIWGNRGAEAMLATTIGEVRKRCPSAQFGVYSYYPAHDRALVNDPAIHIFDARPKTLVTRLFFLPLLHGLAGWFNLKLPLPDDIQFLRDSQVLLDIGGITFNDGRLVFLLYNIFSILPALLMNVPVVKLSQAMGPFNHPINRVLSRFFLGKCLHLFARGEETARFLDQLGLPRTQWDESADIAMLFQPQYSLSDENPGKLAELLQSLETAHQQGKQIIAFSPSILLMKKSESDYINSLLDLLQTMQQENQRFLFFPNASRESSVKTRNNDIAAIRRIREAARLTLPESELERTLWVDYDINNAAIRQIVNASDLLITSRFHAMISGLVTSTPTMVIGWSHKYHEVLSTFSMAEYGFALESDPEIVSQTALRLLKTLPEVHAQLLSALPAQQQSAAVQFDYLQEHFAWKS